MSIDSKRKPSLSWQCKGLAIAAAALLTVGMGSASVVRAQDMASPEASPTAECDAPEFVPGGATPTAGDMAGMDMASPVADTTVTPEPEPEGTPAEGDTADEIIAAAENLIACLNGGDVEGAVALMTDDFLVGQFGSNSHDEAVENIKGFSFGDADVENPQTYEDGYVSVDVTYQGSEYQLSGETWYFVQDGEYWKIDDLENFTPDFEGDAAVVGVTLSETKGDDGAYTYSIVPNATELATPEVLVLHGINKGAVDHEIVAFRLPEGADPAGLLDGSIKESDIEFIGQVSVKPGDEVDMVLEGLEPGTYTLACFVTGPDGKPHAADGMITQITLDPAS